MVKRITAGLMLIVLCIGLCACGGGSSTKDGSSDSVGAFADQSGGGDNKYPGNPDEIDYPKVSDPKNSVLALTDTLTGNKVYIGQSKAEIEQFYGEGEVDGKRISYPDYKLYITFDENNLVNYISIFNNIIDSATDPNYYKYSPENKSSHTAKNERFKTDKGLTLNNSFDDFQKAYMRKYRISRDTHIVNYNGQKHFLCWHAKKDNSTIDSISISYFNAIKELSPHHDYGNPDKAKNSDMAITDTKTGKQIYLGQSKKEIEEILGECFGVYAWNAFAYQDRDDLIYVYFDDEWCVNRINFPVSPDNVRYVTHRGMNASKTPEDFRTLYNTDKEKVELEQNGVNFFIELNFNNENEIISIDIKAD